MDLSLSFNFKLKSSITVKLKQSIIGTAIGLGIAEGNITNVSLLIGHSPSPRRALILFLI